MIKAMALLVISTVSVPLAAATVDFRIMETTYLHSNMMNVDYDKDKAHG